MQQSQQGEDSQTGALEGRSQKGERKRKEGRKGRGGVNNNRKKGDKKRTTEKGEKDKD